MTDIQAAVNELLHVGMVETDTIEDANKVARATERRGYATHVNQALSHLKVTYKPSVELCQGAHCHCRY